MSLNPQAVFIGKAPAGTQAQVNVDNVGKLQTSRGGTRSSLNITAAAVVKATPGRIAKLVVTTAGAAGTVNDCITTGAAAAGNLIATIPATIGIYDLDWPCLVGITITPGAAQVVSVSYT